MRIRILAGLSLFTLGLPAQDLPDGNGRTETEHTCSQCHEIDRVTSLRQDREAWNATMAKMTAYGMKSTEKDYALVLDYLSAHFPADAISKVNVNTASAVELESGLSLRRSQSTAVVAYREKNGPFKSMDDLKKVPALESAKLDEKKDRIAF